MAKSAAGEEADTARVVERLSRFVNDLDDPKNFPIDAKKIADDLEADFPSALKAAATLDSKTGKMKRPGLPEGPRLNIYEKTGTDLMNIILGTVMSMKGASADVLKLGVMGQSKQAVKNLGIPI